ncbi:MAG: teichoic acid biosynthesis protein, partial [Proteobacteria bacterium]
MHEPNHPLTRTTDSKQLYERSRLHITDEDERKTRYALYYEAIPTDPTMIFYESMGGTRMMDNPLAIFRAACADGRFEDYTHVWSVSAFATIPNEYKNRRNIIFVCRHTDMYMQYLAKSGYLICNSTFPDYFVRKPNQRYLNTWHGIAYKRVGRGPESPIGGVYAVYNLLQATHILSPCPFMTDIQLYTMGLNGVYSGELAESGYPRIDMTMTVSDEAKRASAAALSIDPSRQTVLYAPTWRGGEGESSFDTTRLERDLNALAELDANIIFLGHHLMMKHIKGKNFGSVILPPQDSNTNELLALADILITDYSSIFFDFLVTGKPIIHYMYDYNDYSVNRGLNLSVADLPGDVCYDSDDMVGLVKRSLS